MAWFVFRDQTELCQCGYHKDKHIPSTSREVDWKGMNSGEQWHKDAAAPASQGLSSSFGEIEFSGLNQTAKVKISIHKYLQFQIDKSFI